MVVAAVEMKSVIHLSTLSNNNNLVLVVARLLLTTPTPLLTSLSCCAMAATSLWQRWTRYWMSTTEEG